MAVKINVSPSHWEKFNDKEKKLEFLKKWGLVSPTRNWFKTLIYSGISVDIPTICECVGYTSFAHTEFNEAIIDVNGELVTIHPQYLKEMQDFKVNLPDESKNRRLPSKTIPTEYIVVDFQRDSENNKKICEIQALKVQGKTVISEFFEKTTDEKTMFQKFFAFCEDLPIAFLNSEKDEAQKILKRAWNILLNMRTQKMKNALFNIGKVAEIIFPNENFEDHVTDKTNLSSNVSFALQTFQKCYESIFPKEKEEIIAEDADAWDDFCDGIGETGKNYFNIFD